MDILVSRCVDGLYETCQNRHLVRQICEERTWGILKPDELDELVAEVMRRLSKPDLSYAAYKRETGDESRNFLSYRLWVAKRKKEAEARFG